MSLPAFNVDTDKTLPAVFVPGLAAAVVMQAIELITNLATATDQYANGITAQAVDAPINALGAPDAAGVRWSSSLTSSQNALDRALSPGDEDEIVVPGLPGDLMDAAVASLTYNMLDAFDRLFPGLDATGDAADAAARAALQAGAPGVTYVEAFDRAAADTALAFGRLEVADQQADLMAAAAAGGHRFLPGAAHGAVAKLHAGVGRAHDAAIAAAFQARLDAERRAKLALAKAAAGIRANKIRDLTGKVADLFNKKRQARALHIADQDAVIDQVTSMEKLTLAEQTRIQALVLETAKRRHDIQVKAALASDYDLQKAKLNSASGQELVDMLGNMVTQLWNQVRGSGQFSGSERDTTDWS